MNKFFSFSVSLIGSSSFALVSIPFGIGSATAQEAKTTQGTAAELGVMGISLKDAIKPNIGTQVQTQGAGTPNKGKPPTAIDDAEIIIDHNHRHERLLPQRGSKKNTKTVTPSPATSVNSGT